MCQPLLSSNDSNGSSSSQEIELKKIVGWLGAIFEIYDMIYECFSTLRHICTFPFSLVLTIFYFHALFIDFSHFSINQINHIIIIIVITQHLPVVPVDTPVVV